MVANCYNINTTIVIPKTQSEEKNTLKNLGAKLIEVEAVPYMTKNYVKYSKNVSLELGKKLKKKFIGQTNLIIQLTN